MNKLVEEGIVKADFLFSDPGDELCTGLACRVEAFLSRRVCQKMSLVLRRQKRRLVMIEPPCQTLVRTIFEIHYRILISVELVAIKSVAGAMHRGRVRDLRVPIDGRTVKFCEDRGRRYAVKAVAVIENAKFHIIRKCR